MSSRLALSDYEKPIMEELSILTDETPLKVRDIQEQLFLHQLDDYANGRDILIPFWGKIKIKYNGDFLSGGERVADLDIFFSPSELARRLIGDIEDGESEVLRELMQKKISMELRDVLDQREK
jgi:hypothetical protein